MSYATITTLEKEVESLKDKMLRQDDELRELTGKPSREEEQKAFHERIAQQKPQQIETAASAFVKQQIERQRQEAESWLFRCGLPDDASNSLKQFVSSFRGSDEWGLKRMSVLAVAIAGKQPNDETGLRDVIECWPEISPAVQAALTAMASRYVWALNYIPVE